MVNNSKRFLSLLLALVMVIALMPVGFANAEEETLLVIGDEVTAVEEGVSYVICLHGTNKALTNKAGSTGWGTTTRLTVASTFGSDENIWTLESSGDGYKLKNGDSYLTLGGSNNIAELNDTGDVFTFSYKGDDIGWTIGNGTRFLNNLNDSGSIGGYDGYWGGDGSDTKFDVHKVVERPASEVDPYGKLRGFWKKVEGSVNSENAVNGKDGPFEFAWDNNPQTHWHTDYGCEESKKGKFDNFVNADDVNGWTPKEGVEFEGFYGEINFGAQYTINQFSFTPRQDGGTGGRVLMADLQVKANESDAWITVAENAKFDDTADKKTIEFTTQEVQYVRFVAKKSNASNDGHWVAVSEFDINYDPSLDVPELFDITGANMTLGESLDMNFFVKPEYVEGVTGVYAKITKKFADNREDSVTTVDLDENKMHNGEYYFTLSDVSAKEMTDEITVVIYNGNHEAISNVWTDSMKGYAERLYDKKDEYKAFAADLLNYGAAAQTYFNYNTENLANVGEKAQAMLGSATTAVAAAPAQNKVAPCVGATLLLQNRIQLNFVYKTEDLAGVQSATAVIGEDEKEIPASKFGYVDEAKTYMYIPVEGVKIADCYENITLTLGEDASTATTDSVANYCERVEGDLFDAILKLATSAKDVLGK